MSSQKNTPHSRGKLYWSYREPKKCFYEFILCVKNSKIVKLSTKPSLDVTKLIFDIFMMNCPFYGTGTTSIPQYLELIFPRVISISPHTLKVVNISAKLFFRSKAKVKIHFELTDNLLGARLDAYENYLLKNAQKNMITPYIPQKFILKSDEKRKNYSIISVNVQDLYATKNAQFLNKQYQEIPSGKLNTISGGLRIKKGDIINEKFKIIINNVTNIPAHNDIQARSRVNFSLQK